MYHTIEFTGDWTFDLEVSPQKPLERLQIRDGTRVAAQLRTYVIETPFGHIEAADLFFHALVLLADRRVDVDAVGAELERRAAR